MRRRVLLLSAAGAVLVTAAVVPVVSHTQDSPSAAPTVSASPSVAPPPSLVGPASVGRNQPRPNDRLSPGAVDPKLTADYLCTHTTDERRLTPDRLKNAVYREYGLPAKGDPGYVSGKYEIDHRVPLWAGGKDVQANLWPEFNDRPKGALNTKDILERRLYTAVCRTRTVPLQEAQQAFMGDWVQAYNRYGADVG